MKKKHNYEVVVGNVGTMPYTVAKLAKECYDTYVTLSKNGEGRAAHEPVALFKDGEIVKEYHPNLIAAMFKIDEIKQEIANCPKDQVIILCSNWSINCPKYPDSFAMSENEANDMYELEVLLGASLIVTDYNDLVADPHGIYND